jgi:transmembrane sensor
MTQNVYDFPDRLIIEEEAGEWLIKLDGDTALSAEEREALVEWLKRSARHKAALYDLAEFWGKMNILTELAVPLGSHESQAEKETIDFAPPGIFTFNRVSMAMVMFMLCAVITFTFWQHTPNSLSDSNGLYATIVGQQQTTTLADNSVIQLNTNSQIEVKYDKHFRNVYLLQGEGHFSVAKDPDRPFRVYAGDGMIQAVGTAFSVHLKHQDISITVTEGQVALTAVNEMKIASSDPDIESNSQVIAASGEKTRTGNLGTLVAGQSTVMKHLAMKESKVKTSLDSIQTIEEPELARRLSWRDGLLIYSGETLEEVVTDISRYTTVSIEIVDPEVKTIKIGGQFKVGETDAMFDVLEENFGLHVKRLSRNQVQLYTALK